MALDVIELLSRNPKKASTVMSGLAAGKKVSVTIGSQRITAQPFDKAMEELERLKAAKSTIVTFTSSGRKR